jgi:hypothetical protein
VRASPYSIEERLVARYVWCVVASVWVHERQHTGQTMSQVIAAFWERFNKAPPQRTTLLDWEKRAFARSGRNTTRLDTCAVVAASIERSPMKSTRKLSSKAWCATVNNARPHEERLECQAVSPNFHEWTTTKFCAELWKTPFAQLLQKYSDVCHKWHGGASVCVSSIKVHIRIHWTCNQVYVIQIKLW